MRTEELFRASEDTPADDRILPDTPAESRPIQVSGSWDSYRSQPNGDITAPWDYRLYHRSLRRSFVVDPFPGTHMTVVALVGDSVIVYRYVGTADIRPGYYRCDLRVLCPEAYASTTGGDVPPTARDATP
jgi:hypothetical protein